MDENEKLFVKNYCWDILKKAVKKPNTVRNREMLKSREKIFNFLSLLFHRPDPAGRKAF